MNGFYTCLLGNAVTMVCATQPMWVGVPLLVVMSGVCIWCERAHIEAWFAHKGAK